MNICSQKCMWHKAKTLVKRLQEAVRGTKTVKPAVFGACEHVREVKCFTKKELELWLKLKCVHVAGVSTRKKDELVEIVWGVLFLDEAGKHCQMMLSRSTRCKHCIAMRRRRRRSDDGDVLATHVQHLADHWAGDHSCCDKELSNLCKAAGVRTGIHCTRRGGMFISSSRAIFNSSLRIRCARMTFNNECFHSVINKYATKRLNFPKSYEARVCCTALEWNKNKRSRRLRTVFRKPTNVTHRRHSARQHIYAARDTSWRFDIATAVFGSPQVGDWARNMLQQSDVDDPVIEHYDEEADYGLHDAVESAVEGVVAEGDDVYVEAGNESASDDEKSSSDSDTDGAAHRLDFDGPVLSQVVSVAQE
ncbi:hypothetical protein CBR_g31697 [Chara braunii]|uniref:Uncharacterized protein n=1 Tax=Chara braunii TaxID=69332 RepID=A0A388JY07_CHABU|nr:hypothetical protein CBR_g31697 [Chara braunii]|eukprot:GBG62680.1 hypothetical protein CBR_g31697 [Chara braunii]